MRQRKPEMSWRWCKRNVGTQSLDYRRGISPNSLKSITFTASQVRWRLSASSSVQTWTPIPKSRPEMQSPRSILTTKKDKYNNFPNPNPMPSPWSRYRLEIHPERIPSKNIVRKFRGQTSNLLYKHQTSKAHKKDKWSRLMVMIQSWTNNSQRTWNRSSANPHRVIDPT